MAAGRVTLRDAAAATAEIGLLLSFVSPSAGVNAIRALPIAKFRLPPTPCPFAPYLLQVWYLRIILNAFLMVIIALVMTALVFFSYFGAAEDTGFDVTTLQRTCGCRRGVAPRACMHRCRD